ncbi:MAG: universal stress protein [Peptococcaceae bacterium]|nr:universal stress protein [Peptococcaceae bacterium]
MYKRILVPSDGSESSRLAFLNALEIAKITGAEIFLIHVTFTPQAYWGNNLAYGVSISEDELLNLGNEIIQETMKNMDIGNVKIISKIVFGSPAPTIIKIAKDSNVDLIIMGSHGHGPFSGAFLGSVSQRVLSKTACPVMVVKDSNSVDEEM